MRIGIVTDTHVGDRLPVLPEEVCEVLAGVDLVIHAGDHTAPGVARRLAEVAPVVGVMGNHDADAGRRGLPRDRVVLVAGRRIGVTHGTRGWAVERAGALASLALGRPALLGVERAARRRFGAVDAVVMGHIHIPVSRVIDGALLFSPGAVYVPEWDPWFDWDTVPARLYRRFRAGVGAPARRPAVGVMEVGPEGVRARRIELTRPIRARGAGRRPARAR